MGLFKKKKPKSRDAERDMEGTLLTQHGPFPEGV